MLWTDSSMTSSSVSMMLSACCRERPCFSSFVTYSDVSTMGVAVSACRRATRDASSARLTVRCSERRWRVEMAEKGRRADGAGGRDEPELPGGEAES